MNRELNFEGGTYDQFLSADGGQAINPLKMDASPRQFTMAITNTMNVAREVYLTPGSKFAMMLQLLALQDVMLQVPVGSIDEGKPATAVATSIAYNRAPGYVMQGNFLGVNEDSANFSPMSALSTPKKIIDFFGFIANNPTAVRMMKINDNLNDGMQNNFILEVIEESPFRTLQSTIFSPSFEIDQNSMNQQNVKFYTPELILSNQTVLKYTIGPAVGGNARTVSITFDCTATLNTADALQRKLNTGVASVAAKVIEAMKG